MSKNEFKRRNFPLADLQLSARLGKSRSRVHHHLFHTHTQHKSAVKAGGAAAPQRLAEDESELAGKWANYLGAPTPRRAGPTNLNKFDPA